jgi:hypothetical protein
MLNYCHFSLGQLIDLHRGMITSKPEGSPDKQEIDGLWKGADTEDIQGAGNIPVGECSLKT